MSNQPQKCDVSRLQLLLEDQLPEKLQAEVAEHVAQCADCRTKLESLAGDAGWWSEVESCFRANSSRTGLSSTGALPAAGLSHVDDLHEHGDSFAADFVVHFLDPCDEPNTIGRLGDYEILEVIGRGGMGVVLKGFQRELGRYVAVKVIAPHLAASGAARQRFIREARAAAAIVHPNVMPIHAVCTTTRLPYLVMPFVACESLQQRIDRQGALELKEILRIGTQAAAALAAAHAQGLIHRDIKPANILLETGVDRVLLTDFGLARTADDASLTRTGIVTGTPQYMSPEQARGDSIDTRSDLFSLGSVLYAMSTGRPPFRAETTLGILRRISDSRPRSVRETNPDVPEWLDQIISRLHDKSADARFQSASELSELLEGCLAHVQQPNVAPLPVQLQQSVSHSMSRLNRQIVIATIGAAILVLLLVFAWPFMFPVSTDTSSPELQKPEPVPAELSDQSINLELKEFESDLQRLEQRAAQPWDAGQIYDPPTFTLPHQELQP